ncbi:monooxygenase [Anopheles sinensis]|uniref:Monooxygenase n=1 Tax=Anopheles sinensis TaxID=74873 RepID=A0A084VJN6_ANOSI|nr:monooxygenase [Anopheles sinensis]
MDSGLWPSTVASAVTNHALMLLQIDWIPFPPSEFGFASHNGNDVRSMIIMSSTNRVRCDRRDRQCDVLQVQ